MTARMALLCCTATLLVASAAGMQAAPPAAPPAAPAGTQSPPPSAPATAPASAPAPPATAAPPSPVAPPPALPTVWMDIKGLVPKLDSMHDVKPAVAVLARCPASVARAVATVDVPLVALEWRVDAECVSLVGKGEGQKSAVLGQLRWKGTTLEWHWVRASATSFAKAVQEAERVLPWMTLLVTMEGGAQVAVLAPPVHVQRSFKRTQPVAVAVPGAAGRALVLAVAPSEQWANEAASPRQVHLTCAAGAVEVTLDADGRVRAAIEPPGGIAIADLRRKITERQQELRRASEDERPIIEGEITEMRAKLVELEAKVRIAQVPWPAMPTIRVRDAAGREYAVLDLKPESP